VDLAESICESVAVLQFTIVICREQDKRPVGSARTGLWSTPVHPTARSPFERRDEVDGA
jgi:hypothetical protein